MKRRIKLAEPSGSPYGLPHEAKFKPCNECQNHEPDEVCWKCNGQGELEMSQEEIDFEEEARWEERYEN